MPPPRAAFPARGFCVDRVRESADASPRRERDLSRRRSRACGVERWAVKTVSDRRARLVDLMPRPTSVAARRMMARARASFVRACGRPGAAFFVTLPRTGDGRGRRLLRLLPRAARRRAERDRAPPGARVLEQELRSGAVAAQRTESSYVG